MRLEFGENTRSYLTDYIKFADGKAGAVLTLGIAVASAAGAVADRTSQSFAHVNGAFSVVAILLGFPVVVSTVMLILHAIRAIAPNTKSAQHSLASFPDIASMRPEDYVAACRGLSEDGAVEAYAQVNARLATIATAKFASITEAVWWLRVQVISTYAICLVCGVVHVLDK
jgi:hypothetical protein